MKYDKDVVLEFYKDNGIELVSEFRFHSTRLWKFDFADPDNMIALEIEGGIWGGGGHTRGKAFKEDLEKYNEATAMGWSVIRTVPSQCCMMDLVDIIHRTIESKKKK